MKFIQTLSHSYQNSSLAQLSKIHKFVLAAGCIAAFLFAFWPLYSQVNFYYDQARDAYEAYAIWHNLDVKVSGPATDIPGLYHGAVWYYFLAAIYLVGQGNIDIAATIFFLLSWLSLPFIWLLAKELSKDTKVATASVILYSFSPLFQLSTRWISNPTLGMMVMPIIMYSLWMYINKPSKKIATVLGVSTALMIQGNLGYALVLLSAPLFLLLQQKKEWKSMLFGFMSFLITLSSFALAELKFKGRGVVAFIKFFSEKDGKHTSLLSILESTFHKWHELTTYSFVNIPQIVTTVLLFCAIALLFIPQLKKQLKEIAYLLIWLFNLILFQFFSTGISTSVFVHFPYIIAFIILSALILSKVVSNTYIFTGFVLILIVFQVQKSIALIAEDRNPLTVQIGATYQNVKKVIDYTYANSDSATFTVNTITSPLFINTTWAYAYNFYGLPKYHALPFWDGRDQAGILGSMPVRTEQKHQLGETRYLIIEPTTGIPEFFLDQVMGEENSWSDIVTETKIGNFTIQKRKYKDTINEPLKSMSDKK